MNREILSQSAVITVNSKVQNIIKYLTKCGSKITCLTLLYRLDWDVIVDSVIQHCPNLIVLDVQEELGALQQHKLRQSNSNLTEMYTKRISSVMDEEDSPVRLPYHSTFHGNAIADAVQMGNLIKLNLNGVDEIADLLTIALYCPLLRSLGLAESGIDNATLTEIVRACPHIVNLDVQFTIINDAGIHAVVTHLPRLQSLNIQECGGFTSAYLVHLYTHCADTLHTLYLESHARGPYLENAVWNDLLAHCTQIRKLYWRQQDTFPEYRLPETLCNITTLMLGGDSASSANLLLVGQYCRKLETLCICGVGFYRSLNLDSIVLGCPALHTVYYNGSPFNRGMQKEELTQDLQRWKILWPHLTVMLVEDTARQLQFNILDMPV